jgi:hypothetical protein
MSSFLPRLNYCLRAQAGHGAFILVRGGVRPPEYSNHPAWGYVSWEQAIIDGRSVAVVVYLLLQELSLLVVPDGESWAPGRQNTLVLRKRQELQTFDEVNHLVNLWLAEFPLVS